MVQSSALKLFTTVTDTHHVVPAQLNTSVLRGCQEHHDMYIEDFAFSTDAIPNSSPFCLAVNERPKTQVWYKQQRMGINSINSFIKAIASQAEVQGKKLTNHVQCSQNLGEEKLKAANQPHSAIIGVTGHTNKRSLADYEEGDDNERAISSIISAEFTPVQSSRVHQPLERLDAVNTGMANTMLMNDKKSMTVTISMVCEVTINYNIAGQAKNTDQQQ